MAKKANSNYDGLEDEEIMTLISVIQPMFRVWEEAYIQFEVGRLDRRMWEPMNRQFTAYLSFPAFGRVWNLRRSFYDDKFANFVDNAEAIQLPLR